MKWISPFKLRTQGILGMNRRNVEFINRYNPREYYPLVDDKLKTKLIASKAGLMMPELLQTVHTQSEIEGIEELLKNLKQFVIKPSQGSGGKGILVIIDHNEEGFVKSSGEHMSLAQVKRHLTNTLSGLHSLGGRTDVAIVESLVVASPMFRDVSYEGVPDIRLIVFQGYPVMGMLRLATKESDGKANLHQGAVGVGLDIGSGRSIAAVQHNHPVTHHPDTGADLKNIKVPNWKKLVRLAASCYEVTKLGYLGCDIVLDEYRGPLLLELNARPGLSIQLANQCGLLPRLREIENLEVFYAQVDDRVRYSMQNFSSTVDPAQASLFTDSENLDDTSETTAIQESMALQ